MYRTGSLLFFCSGGLCSSRAKGEQLLTKARNKRVVAVRLVLLNGHIPDEGIVSIAAVALFNWKNIPVYIQPRAK